MKKLIRSMSILLCLCLLLSAAVTAAGTGKVCTTERGGLMFTLPEGLQMLDTDIAEELIDPDAYTQMFSAMLSSSQSSEATAEVLGAAANADIEQGLSFLGLMFQVEGIEMEEGFDDFADLDDERVAILDAVYSALGETINVDVEGFSDLKIGMWKNSQTNYMRIHFRQTVEGDLYWADSFATFKSGKMYMFVFVSAKEEMQTVGEELMKTMIVDRYSAYPGGFPDLAGHWAAESAAKAVELGLFTGMTETEFAPDQGMTRAMLVAVLYRMQNEPDAGSSTFTDVPEGRWYSKAVAWASENGIVTDSGGKFDPNGQLTREQLAAILWRYAQYEKRDVSVGEETNILSYADAQDVSSYAVTPMQWACGAGMIQGASGKLMPKNTTTRAQVAAVLVRYLAA